MIPRAWTTLGPMLAAAALVLWGAERLARRTVEQRVPADRVRLLDFSATLRGELDRLAGLYEEHLSALAAMAVRGGPQSSLEKNCEAIMGVRTLSIFSEGGKKRTDVAGARPGASSFRLPTLELASGAATVATGDDPFKIPKPAGNPGDTVAGSGWSARTSGLYRVYWNTAVDPKCSVGILIDDSELQECLTGYLHQWSEKLYAPLAETGQLVAIYGPRSSSLFQLPETAGPAAVVVPYRIALGEWQVQAWDRLNVRTEHDTATLLLSCGIACTLVLAGIYLTIVQNRALKLAEERVSFVNRVSHELGTPLTNILLNLDLAQRWTEGRPEESRRRLKLVHEEVQRLARLVQNVLTFSRGERKTLELHPSFFVPDDLVTEVLGQFEPSLERHGIRVERSGGAVGPFLADADAFSQIVGNLISNVEKYAAEGGWLGIDAATNGGRLRIRVADAGPGIPAQARKRIFEAFERVSDGIAEGATGAGLGLAIARDLAVRMGGTLLLQASEKGAVFELDLPASPGRLELLSSDQSSAA